jgi:hypothetical protein
MNGTCGFVYSGVRGAGLGVFTIRNSVFLGSDTGGAKYSGHAVQDMATGAVTILFEMFAPEGTAVIHGTSVQDINYMKTGFSVTLQSNLTMRNRSRSTFHPET